MESLSSAAASGRFPCFSGAGIDSRRANPIGEIRVCSGKDREGYARSRVSRGVLRSEFGDDGHVKYYGGKPRFGLNKEGRKEGGNAEIKKKLKMSKGLTKEEDFSEFYWMERRGGGGSGGDGEVIEGQEKPISEAAEVLLKQLEQLKAEEKGLKRKIKEQKAKLKAERKKVMMDSESSSSSCSSESSDSECGEVIDMGRLRTEVLAKEEGNNAGNLALPNGVLYREATTGFPSDVAANGAVTKRIEVCMGKKCKNSGGPALLEEFKNLVGVEGAVVECKCLGKCRDGPNVRVSNSLGENQAPEADDSVRIPANPLLIGVSLEDVNAIVTKYLGKDENLESNVA
ncbi:diacylglycerol O-acyltransferase 3 isoform X1 [Rhodamnia argentea]|uniref:Diacylglycerol O-acyltransferase 3 isoform X1 n=1 Tax=Rhodamnia argentea TaxID=178133 RepID=A0A8B8Q063_9MYRT|nr:diacylglycerol O-acyltransferase 3 isoform X1 [Rhodamnia argentea]